MASAVHVSNNPLVRHKVAVLRDRDTGPAIFRRMVRDLSQLLLAEAAGDLRLETGTVRTPLAECPAERIVDRVGLVPILRAGLGMAEALLEWLPEAEVWHLGLYRDHQTLRPVTYYNKLPVRPALDFALVLDPMLATGGSAVAAIDLIKGAGIRRIHLLGLLAAPEGLGALREAHPDVPVTLAALDSHLDEDKYIVPGLGDAGDRQFGTG